MKYSTEKGCLLYRNDFSDICRLCVNRREDLLNMFDENLNIGSSNCLLPEKVKACLDVVVKLNDGLPDRICQSCHDTVLKFHIFREQCILNDAFLRQKLFSFRESNETHSEDPELTSRTIQFQTSLSNGKHPQENEFAKDMEYEASNNYQSQLSDSCVARESLGSHGNNLCGGVLIHLASEQNSKASQDIRGELEADWSDSSSIMGLIESNEKELPWRFSKDNLPTPPKSAKELEESGSLTNSDQILCIDFQGVNVKWSPLNSVTTGCCKSQPESKNAPITINSESESEFVDVEALDDKKVNDLTQIDSETRLCMGNISRNDLGLWICNICKSTRKTFRVLKRHILDHFLQLGNQCVECEVSFPTPKAFERHVQKHKLSSLSLGHFCEICGKAFQLKHLLLKHNATEHSIPSNKNQTQSHTKKFRAKCDKCPRVFHTSLDMEEHNDSCCENVSTSSLECSSESDLDIMKSPPVQIKGSYPSFGKNWKQLKRRERESVRINKPLGSFVCYKCGLRFRSTKAITSHFKTQHNSEFPFKCDFFGCNMEFSNRLKFVHHKLKHTEKTFKCDLCDKTYLKKVLLEYHMTSHSEDRPFKCTFCEKAFKREYYLRRHLITHSVKKLFKCDVCQKCFSRHDHLLQHETTHSGSRNFLCDICGKNFNCKSNWHAHSRVHKNLPARSISKRDLKTKN